MDIISWHSFESLRDADTEVPHQHVADVLSGKYGFSQDKVTLFCWPIDQYIQEWKNAKLGRDDYLPNFHTTGQIPPKVMEYVAGNTVEDVLKELVIDLGDVHTKLYELEDEELYSLHKLDYRNLEEMQNMDYIYLCDPFTLAEMISYANTKK